MEKSISFINNVGYMAYQGNSIHHRSWTELKGLRDSREKSIKTAWKPEVCPALPLHRDGRQGTSVIFADDLSLPMSFTNPTSYGFNSFDGAGMPSPFHSSRNLSFRAQANPRQRATQTVAPSRESDRGRNDEETRVKGWRIAAGSEAQAVMNPYRELSAVMEELTFLELQNEAPSCLYVGRLHEAHRVQLEALYLQARDSYYSGTPLVVDDMFDQIEKQLRRMGSKRVLKYPRCSLRAFSAYADAEMDPSQLLALGLIWASLLTGGVALMLAPPFCLIDTACSQLMQAPHPIWWGHAVNPLPPPQSHTIINATIIGLLGSALGATIAAAAVRSLARLWQGSTLALKGSCPSCGEEVYAFVRADESPRPRHKCECHVCEHPLVFHATLEPAPEDAQKSWAYGRIYLASRAKDLAPLSGSSERRDQL